MRFTFLLGRTFLPGLLAVAVFSHAASAMAEQGAAAGTEGITAVQLRVDGNIPGQVGMFDPSGRLTPVRAQIYFVRNGHVVASARSDEWGRFQATGLSPGSYSMLAVSREGFGAISITVRQDDASAAIEQPALYEAGLLSETLPLLHLTLVPTSEFDLLAEMLAAEFSDSAMGGGAAPFSTGFAGGGGGGGGGAGGALGVLLGAGGLAGGIAALATDSRTQATESSP